MYKNKLVHSFETTIRNNPKRSKFDRNHEHKTTINASDLIPVYWDEVLPGDNFKLNTKAVIRQNTMIKPVMDNSYIDVMYYFVPNRIIWDGWKQFMGENETGAWAETSPPTMPQTTAPDGGWQTGTIADYMGVPPLIANISISSLPFRAYTLIFNEWFRDQNLQQPSNLTTDNSTTAGTNGKSQTIDIQCGGFPAKSNKYHDYFTSALPQPQKGEPITINLGQQALVQTGERHNITGNKALTFSSAAMQPLDKTQSLPIIASAQGGNSPYGEIQVNATTPIVPTTVAGIQPDNLYADLSEATAITINELRTAITLQQMLELDARGGTRYVEYIKSHFGIDSGDARQQRPEYLGGFHQAINVNQTVGTNQATTDTQDPQGNLAGWSHTGINKHGFNKTFTEHGIIIGVATIRYNHTYQQGLEKAWKRMDRYDYYDPIFAHIGEQPIYNYEIYTTGTEPDNETFGFKEPWAEYRYKPNRTSGLMRSQAPLTIDYWHYGDHYTAPPRLSDAWIQENQSNIDRTLAIKSTGENGQPQYNADFYFEIICERAMPVYSVPGLKRI